MTTFNSKIGHINSHVDLDNDISAGNQLAQISKDIWLIFIVIAVLDTSHKIYLRLSDTKWKRKKKYSEWEMEGRSRGMSWRKSNKHLSKWVKQYYWT